MRIFLLILFCIATVAVADAQYKWTSDGKGYYEAEQDGIVKYILPSMGKIVIADARVGALRVGGHFRWSNTDAFVRLLTRGFPVRATLQGDTIVLNHR